MKVNWFMRSAFPVLLRRGAGVAAGRTARILILAFRGNPPDAACFATLGAAGFFDLVCFFLVVISHSDRLSERTTGLLQRQIILSIIA